MPVGGSDDTVEGSVPTIGNDAATTMTPEQLEEIPGIGPTMVEKIQLAVNSYYGQFESQEGGAAPDPDASLASIEEGLAIRDPDASLAAAEVEPELEELNPEEHAVLEQAGPEAAESEPNVGSSPTDSDNIKGSRPDVSEPGAEGHPDEEPQA